jgi:site-specific recombinase XerD
MLDTLAARYVAHRLAAREIQPDTAAGLRRVLRDLARHVPDDPDRVTQRQIERWLGRARSPGTRRHRLSTARNFWRWMIIECHTRTDPTIAIRAPRVVIGLPRNLPQPDAAALVRASSDPRTRLAVLLELQEGLRLIEVARAQLGDVDLHRRMLIVRGKGGGGQPTRAVPLSEETQVALGIYLDERGVIGGPLLQSRLHPGQGISAAYIGRLVRRAMVDAGLKRAPHDGRSPHALRHTCAQDMIDSGADIRQVQKALGHATVRTTEWYLRGEVSGLREAMAGRRYAS